jgi:hypothetical protein
MMRWNYYCDDDEVEKNGETMDDEREKWANKKNGWPFHQSNHKEKKIKITKYEKPTN